MNPFEFLQMPSPSKPAHEPNDQFCAPGGFQQRITDALQFQSTELAAAQPTPALFPARSPSVIALPSMRTLSNTVPDDQLSIAPLSSRASFASHCTKAFGPAAQ